MDHTYICLVFKMASVSYHASYASNPPKFASRVSGASGGYKQHTNYVSSSNPCKDEQKPTKFHKNSDKSSRTFYPVPKGNSPYAKAKRAEYIERDLAKSEFFLRQAIIDEDRAESALKDLAGLLHRQGRTNEACSLLEEFRYHFTDQSKYENLLGNLQKQIVPTGNCLNKWLKVSGLRPTDTVEMISAIFKDDSRIHSITIGKEETYYGKNHFAVVKFGSHSAARKTMEGFSHWGRYKLEWLSVSGEVAGDVYHNKPDGRRDRRTFAHRLFWRDPEDRILPLPLDKHDSDNASEVSTDDEEVSPTIENLLGTNLAKLVFGANYLNLCRSKSDIF